MIEIFSKPESISAAVALKEEHGGAACYLGGGTFINNSVPIGIDNNRDDMLKELFTWP